MVLLKRTRRKKQTSISGWVLPTEATNHSLAYLGASLQLLRKSADSIRPIGEQMGRETPQRTYSQGKYKA